ncbi:hypothetical protein QOZ80_9AG0689230 [Eleusine coracana subsp. coracana]|nr:hypothetical protein QOZ80_9AG0689230 [Eleusine coracana subsp. coracana]
MGLQQSKATTVEAGWSFLPPELADLILHLLSSLADRVRFASVCRRWRHTAIRYSPPTLPPVLPWINFLDGRFQSLPDGEMHSFHFGKHDLCVGSFGNWMLFERVGNKPTRRHFLKDPLTGSITWLPGHCNEPVHLSPDDGYSQGTWSGSRSTNFFTQKVIVCSGNLIAAMIRYRRHALAVVCCRPGMLSWSTGVCTGPWYQDMAFYKGKLYTITTEGDLFAHEVTKHRGIGEPRISRIEHVIRAPPLHTLDGFYYAAFNCVRSCYLVVSRTGKLLMVRWIVPVEYYSPQDSTKQMTLKVFEADFEMSRWLEVESIGDEALFVSSNCSKAIKAPSHCGCIQGDRIYFIDDGFMFYPFRSASSKPRNCGVYDMRSKSVHPIALGKVRIRDQSKALWFFPTSTQ